MRITIDIFECFCCSCWGLPPLLLARARPVRQSQVVHVVGRSRDQPRAAQRLRVGLLRARRSRRVRRRGGAPVSQVELAQTLEIVDANKGSVRRDVDDGFHEGYDRDRPFAMPQGFQAQMDLSSS